jgi:sensor histidine kinase YesM
MVDVALVLLYLLSIHDSPLLMYGRVVLVSVLGVIVSHLMRKTIITLKIFQKDFIRQVVYLLIITFCFSAIFLGVWICIYYTFNLQNVGESEQSRFQIFYWVAYGFFGTLFIWNLFYFVYHYVQGLLIRERQKIISEKQMWEMEAQALRAQMNPNFIFKCINSIKTFVQTNEEDKAVSYLIILSKLIRIIFQNSDKKEVTLFDELETCRLYVQLESMDFDNKFDCRFEVDERIDLKSIHVPPLIIQPFIENAIWYGIMPKENGGTISVVLEKKEESFSCIIEDNGVGRDTSKKIKSIASSGYKSKEIHLTQSRHKRYDILNQGMHRLKL